MCSSASYHRLTSIMLDRRTFLRFRPAARSAESLPSTPSSPFAASPPPASSPATLAPYVPSEANPWGPVQARHLLRRTGIGARPDDVQALLGMEPATVVRRIVRTAKNRPLLAEPEWAYEVKPRANASSAERRAFYERNRGWISELYRDTFSRLLGDDTQGLFRRLGEAFRERMTVIWSNHFVADLRAHNIATWLFEYRQTLRRHALGDFRGAVHEIGLTASMLAYLDGADNQVGAPNENYARELLELFTMGVESATGAENYTQADIVELSRALTGYRTVKDRNPRVEFWPERHDSGLKTIFGRTAAFGYDDIVPLLFEARGAEIAHFVAGKLSRALVCDEPDPAFVAAVAARLRAERFELAPVVEAIFQSAYFFAPEHVGAIIRSPVDLMLGSVYEFGQRTFEGTGLAFRNKTARMGQDIFNPPDVRGWEEGRAWINTGTLNDRVKYGRERIRYMPESFIPNTLARPEAADPRLLAATLCEELLAWTLSEEEIDDLANDHLRDGVSESDYYWDPASEDAARRLDRFLQQLVSLPAYQLR